MVIKNPLDKSNINPDKGILTSTQKTALGFLIFFSVVIVMLWSWQLRNRILEPFTASTNLATSSQEELLDNLLRTLDSDKDGLSDYDELNIHKTSPYLEDSDSDGLSDQQEIVDGTDPNCPQGQDCRSTTIINNNVASTSELFLPVITESNYSTTTKVDVTGVAPTTLEALLQGKADAAILRQFYLDGGMSQVDLDKFSDEELMKMYRGVLETQGIISN